MDLSEKEGPSGDHHWLVVRDARFGHVCDIRSSSPSFEHKVLILSLERCYFSDLGGAEELRDCLTGPQPVRDHHQRILASCVVQSHSGRTWSYRCECDSPRSDWALWRDSSNCPVFTPSHTARCCWHHLGAGCSPFLVC